MTAGWLGSMTMLLALVVLAGCASPRARAPVESRSAPARPSASLPVPAPGPVAIAPAALPASAPAAEAPVKLPPGAENAGKPGYYVIKPGDTLIRIGLDNGQNWREIARWNAIDNPNVLEVGQVLRILPPALDAGVASARPVVPGARGDARPPMVPGAPVGSGEPTVAPPAAPAPPTGSLREAEEEIQWSWPAVGPVASGFDEARNKGLAILGSAGDPVLAAADGRVVYAGSGLRGYGNLVIVKHSTTFLTAYAHNQALLVKEDQVVRRGQKIAEMGSSDADRVQLHFEIRRQGKPVDPARLLPPR